MIPVEQRVAREAFGLRGQIAALAEEAAELSAACCRWLNDKGHREAIMEEVVGVASVAESVRADLGVPEVWAECERVQLGRLRATLVKRGLMPEPGGGSS